MSLGPCVSLRPGALPQVSPSRLSADQRTSCCVVRDAALSQRVPRAQWSRGLCPALASPEELDTLRGSCRAGPVLSVFVGDLISRPSKSETDNVFPCRSCRKETQRGGVSARCHTAFSGCLQSPGNPHIFQLPSLGLQH